MAKWRVHDCVNTQPDQTIELPEPHSLTDVEKALIASRILIPRAGVPNNWSLSTQGPGGNGKGREMFINDEKRTLLYHLTEA
jgi:hypothetical protein